MRQASSEDLCQAEPPSSNDRNEGGAYSHQENYHPTTSLPRDEGHHRDDTSERDDIEEALPDVHNRNRGDGDIASLPIDERTNSDLSKKKRSQQETQAGKVT